MILTDREIKVLMKIGEIKIDNYIPENLGPVSYDLTINENVKKIHRLNGVKADCTKQSEIGIHTKLPIDLKFGEILVFTTNEIITVSEKITGIVYPRSSLTKFPLLFNIAGLVDPGFSGSITGTLYNLSFSSILIKQMRICQIVFHHHTQVETSYDKRKTSKNQLQSGTNSLNAKQDIEFKDH